MLSLKYVRPITFLSNSTPREFAYIWEKKPVEIIVKKDGKKKADSLTEKSDVFTAICNTFIIITNKDGVLITGTRSPPASAPTTRNIYYQRGLRRIQQECCHYRKNGRLDSFTIRRRGNKLISFYCFQGRHYGWQRIQCDDAFWKDMLTNCSFWDLPCKMAAEVYYGSVRVGGAFFFNSPTKKWCRAGCAKRYGNPNTLIRR